MKNIEKKWTLFLIATFVTFFGIANVLIRGTRATDVPDSPVNEAFEDVNFYKCIVDAYNEENNTELAYTDNLTDEQLSSISIVECIGDNDENKKIKSTAGLEKLESLLFLKIYKSNITQIDLSYNKELSSLILEDFYLTDLDLSSNENLEYLDICDENGTIENANLALDKKPNLKNLSLDNLKLSNLDLSYNSLLEQIYIQDEESKISNLNLALGDKANLIDLALYNVNLSNLDLSSNDNLEYLDICDENGTIEDANLALDKKSNLKNLSLDNLKLSDLDLTTNDSLEYLYILDRNGTISNLNLALNNKKNLIDLALYNVNLSNLDLSSNENLEYLYILDENRTIANLNLALNDKGNLLELGLYNVSLSNLDLTNNVLLEVLAIKGTDLSELDLSNNVALKKLLISDNNFSKDIVTYLGEKFTFEMPIVISNETTLGKLFWKIENEEFITKDENENFVGNQVGESNISLYLGETLLFSNNVLTVEISSSIYEVVDNKILVGSANKEEILNNIEYDSVLTVDVDDDLTTLKVMYGDVVLKEFEIVSEDEVVTEEIVFDSNLIVDEEKMIIKNVVVGMTVDALKSKINTNGEIIMLDKDNNLIDDSNSKLKTGDKIKITLSNDKVMIYTISVLGDVYGDGGITSDDLVLCVRHLINGDVIIGDEYINAADINNDGKVSINDVIKLAKHIVTGSGL